ncbi:MAG: hypothetical protein HOV97_05940 [Nonomuraea sp.]|nr:hypothetical protein [Nonomuraea sp.]
MSKKRKKPSRNPAGPSVQAAPEEEGAIMIRTEPTPDGLGWMVTMEITEDHSIALDRDKAIECAWAILGAAAYAEYDASVLAQMTQRVSREAAMQLVIDLRADRPDLNWDAMKPLSVRPGVSVAGRPFLTLLQDEEPVGEWDLELARKHAMVILEAMIVADLDGAYLRCLKGVVGLSDETARVVVGDLQDFRP